MLLVTLPCCRGSLYSSPVKVARYVISAFLVVFVVVDIIVLEWQISAAAYYGHLKAGAIYCDVPKAVAMREMLRIELMVAF